MRRKSSVRTTRIAIVLLPVLIAVAAGAEPHGVGSVLPRFSLRDQHGDPHTLDASARLILFSRDMDGGDVIKETLGEQGGAFLEQKHAVYVADVSGMPRIIRRVIAMPRMRRRPYRMWLDTEGTVTADFPSTEGKATLLFLDRLRITRIEQVASPDELRRALGLSPDPGGSEDERVR
jgi:hypothetical protein